MMQLFANHAGRARRLGLLVALSFCLAAFEAQAQSVTNSDDAVAPRQSEDLSRQLDKSNGVIAPREGVDPAMQKPPPPVNAPTLIVPPPASRNGEPVTPK